MDVPYLGKIGVDVKGKINEYKVCESCRCMNILISFLPSGQEKYIKILILLFPSACISIVIKKCVLFHITNFTAGDLIHMRICKINICYTIE